MKHSIALAALVASTMGFATILPAAAQDQPSVVAAKADRQFHRFGNRDDGPGRNAGILGLVCSDRGAEALEIAFVRLSHRLDLAGEQQPLFDALRTKALTTQTSFADDCKAALPDRSAGTRPDLLDRLKSTLAIEEARLTALNAVLPEFEAFYGSLTDAQKDDLLPRGGMRMHDRGDRGGPDRNAPGRTMRLPAPGRG